MKTNTMELNLNEMEMINGAGLWSDIKGAMKMIGNKADHWAHVFVDDCVKADKENRESGDPTPEGVTVSIIKGWVDGVVDICKGK